MRITISSHIKINKNDIDQKTYSFIDKNLTFINPKYKNAIEFSTNKSKASFIPKNIKAFSIKGSYIYISRGFLNPLLDFFNKQDINYILRDRTVTNESDLELSKIKLRPYQKKASVKAIRKTSGVIKMPCGAGKTITLTDVIRKLKQNTLIIVHTNFIMNQWKSYFLEKYGYTPGVIQGDICDIKPITLAMIPTLYARNLDNNFLNFWGCVVTDECHHMACDQLFSVVNQFPAKYRFGATATARRSDGLTNMVFATLGEIAYNVKVKTLDKAGYLTIPKVKMFNTNFISKYSSYHGIIKEICKNKKRNKLIADNIYSHSKRFNLVLSNRIQHLQELVNEYSKLSGDYKLITGNIKTKERNEIINRMLDGDLHVIFSTQLADEGLDIPNLDVLHLAFPSKSDGIVEQRIGRLQRYKQHTPLVFDYVDQLVPNFYNFTQNRLNLYKELEMEVETVEPKENTKKSITIKK